MHIPHPHPQPNINNNNQKTAREYHKTTHSRVEMKPGLSTMKILPRADNCCCQEAVLMITSGQGCHWHPEGGSQGHHLASHVISDNSLLLRAVHCSTVWGAHSSVCVHIYLCVECICASGDQWWKHFFIFCFETETLVELAAYELARLHG